MKDGNFKPHCDHHCQHPGSVNNPSPGLDLSNPPPWQSVHVHLYPGELCSNTLVTEQASYAAGPVPTGQNRGGGKKSTSNTEGLLVCFCHVSVRPWRQLLILLSDVSIFSQEAKPESVSGQVSLCQQDKKCALFWPFDVFRDIRATTEQRMRPEVKAEYLKLVRFIETLQEGGGLTVQIEEICAAESGKEKAEKVSELWLCNQANM